jgi:hypothetical protein
MSDRPFALEVNLDDTVERDYFLQKHEPVRGISLAHRLGFRGPGCKRAANALMNYAQNKRTARQLRLDGTVAKAWLYEAICERIYREDIQPVIECW